MYIQNKDLKYQEWAYAQRKYLPYEEKVKLAIRRIQEWDDYWDGQVYLSFSGGLDSTVLLALIRMTLGKEVPAWKSVSTVSELHRMNRSAVNISIQKRAVMFMMERRSKVSR